MNTLDFFSAFILGLMGAAHCFSMCGGLLLSFNALLPQPTNNRHFFILNYNLGRIASYMIAGAIVGSSGMMVTRLWPEFLAFLQLIAALVLIGMGLYIAKWFTWINQIERLGSGVWSLLSPLKQKLLPLDRPIKAIPLGMVWGWLPCGLVYSVLIWSIQSASASSGALIMLGFGLGTLPAMLVVGTFAANIKSLLTNSIFKCICGVLVILYGMWSLILAFIQLVD